MMRAIVIALLLLPLAADARSSTPRAQFMKAEPCPATGKTRGACAGYVVDHVVALKCGGLDHAVADRGRSQGKGPLGASALP